MTPAGVLAILICLFVGIGIAAASLSNSAMASGTEKSSNPNAQIETSESVFPPRGSYQSTIKITSTYDKPKGSTTVSITVPFKGHRDFDSANVIGHFTFSETFAGRDRHAEAAIVSVRMVARDLGGIDPKESLWWTMPIGTSEWATPPDEITTSTSSTEYDEVTHRHRETSTWWTIIEARDFAGQVVSMTGQFKIGCLVGQLSPDQLAAFRDFASNLGPS